MTDFFDNFTAPTFYSANGGTNWTTYSNSDGSCKDMSTIYPQTSCCFNSCIKPIGAPYNGFANNASIDSGGTKHIGLIYSTGSFALPGVFACRINLNGPTIGTTTFEKIVKAFYLIGGSASSGSTNLYIECDYEFIIESAMPWIADTVARPCSFNSTYYSGDGSHVQRPSGSPFYVGDATTFNNDIICQVEVTVASTGVGTITYNCDYYIYTAALPNTKQHIGQTTTTHDSSITSVHAYFDLHYVNPNGTAQPYWNSHSMNVIWFSYTTTNSDTQLTNLVSTWQGIIGASADGRTGTALFPTANRRGA